MPELGARARQDLAPPAQAAMNAAGRTVGAAFAVVSRLRGAKSLHPEGVVHEGVLRVYGNGVAPPAATLLREAAEHPAIVRFSRSIGLPRRVPDLLGISMRLPDVYGPGRHQDVLAVTSIDAPVAHHVFVPASDFQQRVYSTSLPYRSGASSYILGFRPLAASPRPPGHDEQDRLGRAAATGDLRFEFVLAPVMGSFAAVGELRIGDRLPPESDLTRFNPWNTGGGLELTGVLNRLRDYAYPLSQEGWQRARQRS